MTPPTPLAFSPPHGDEPVPTPDRAMRNARGVDEAIAEIRRRFGFRGITRLGHGIGAESAARTDGDALPDDTPRWWPRPHGARDRLVEVVAPHSSGALSLALLWSASAAPGEMVAIVEPPMRGHPGRFYPPAALFCGLDAENLVVVSPPRLVDSLDAAALLTRCEGFGVVLLRLPHTAARRIPSAEAGKLALLSARAGTTLFTLIQGESGALADATAFGGFVDLRLRVEGTHWLWEDGDLTGARLSLAIEKSRMPLASPRQEIVLHLEGRKWDGRTPGRLRLVAALLTGERAGNATHRDRSSDRALQRRLALA